MKKQITMFVLAVLSLMSVMTVSAQSSFKKSDKILEGTVSYTKETDVKASYTLNPSVGYFVTNRVAVGVAAELGQDGDDKTTNVGVFARCYFMNIGKLQTFSQVNLTSNSATTAGVKATSTAANLGLGVNYFVTPRLALATNVANLVNYTSADSHSVMTIGFTGITNPLNAATFGVLYKF